MRRFTHALLVACIANFTAPARAADPPQASPTNPVAGTVQPTAEQRAAALAALCQKVPCRKETRVIDLKIDATKGLRFNSQPLPYADDKGSIVIYPGEKLTVSVVKDGDNLAVPKIVSVSDANGPVDIGNLADAAAPESSLVTFDFAQESGKPDMTLVVSNHTGLTLKYSATAGFPNAQGGLQPTHTSVCPLYPAPPLPDHPPFTDHESWPQAIGILILFNIRPANGDTACD